jgi:hypothetical protein
MKSVKLRKTLRRRAASKKIGSPRVVSPGNTFQLSMQQGHRWIVLTSADEDGSVLVVNLTTLTADTEDRSCVLQRVDYPEYIQHPTSVRYDKAMQVSAERIESETSQIQRTAPVPSATLRKIQEAALASRYLRERFKNIIRCELSGASGDSEADSK